MKKYMVLSAALCVAVAFTGCKSSESAYKKAYEKAKAQEMAQQQTAPTESETVAPVVEKSSEETTVVDNGDNVRVAQEDVALVNGSGLKAYSVVVGSFGLKANAENLQQRLKEAGYDAQLVKNTAKNMYRVIASTFEGKSDAISSRNQLRSKYPDAWLLMK